MISLLLPFVVVPGVSDLEPMDLMFGGRFVAVDVSAGEGELLSKGRAAKLECDLTDGLGRTLLSSSVRGQQIAYVPSGSDSLLEPLLFGMREGGERIAYYAADSFPEGLGGIVPPSTEVVLRVRALISRS